MMVYRIGFIGTGPNPDSPGSDGYAMAYRHASGYQRLEDCELIACADIVRENARAFADVHGIETAHVYEDHETMLAEANPDIVSICTPPGVHAELVIDAARSGVVEAIHCEKPMADTWAECKEMARVCEDEGVQLTINHQMRFGKPFRMARALLDDGAIGRLRRMEFGDDTLYDMGTHLFDLCTYFVDGAPVEWVLTQIDYTEENIMFGTHNENQAISQWQYENGVYGLASTGRGSDFLDCYFRLTGESGVIEIGGDRGILSMREDGSDWRTYETGYDRIYDSHPGELRDRITFLASKVSSRARDRIEVPSYVDRAIEEIVTALKTDKRSELTSANALIAEELIFASWESVRRRGRVELPLEISDNPLRAMVESGELDVETHHKSLDPNPESSDK